MESALVFVEFLEESLTIKERTSARGTERAMAYKQVKEILETIRKFHRKIRGNVEDSYTEMDDPRAKFLLRTFRRTEQQMDLALARYEQDGEAGVLETWIQYDSCDEIEPTLRSGKLPSHSAPDDVLDWKREFDEALAKYYRQLASQVSAPRARELFESLATMTEQLLADQSWLAREEELAPPGDASSE